MKAVTVSQPEASLLLVGRRLHTMPWGTDHRGPLAIHASTRIFTGGPRFDHEYLRLVAAAFGVPTDRVLGHIDNLVTRIKRAVIGEVDLADCRRIVRARYVRGGGAQVLLEGESTRRGAVIERRWRTVTGLDAAVGNFREGRFVWFTRRPRPWAEPRQIGGQRGIWELPW